MREEAKQSLAAGPTQACAATAVMPPNLTDQDRSNVPEAAIQLVKQVARVS
jgi:hypothetical protein